MADMLETVRTRNAATPQSEQADPRQVPNNAGGFAFAIPGEERIHRFLTIGVPDSGTYYVKAPALAKDNAAVVLDWARTRGEDLVAKAAEISVAGRAPSNNPAMFALAAVLGLGTAEAKHAAEAALPVIVRTGSHQLAFTGYLEQFRGWGPVARRAVSSWYLGKDADELAYQLVKYRQRNGWTHADVIRLAHPKPRAADGTPMADHDRLFAWLAKRDVAAGVLPRMVQAYQHLREIEKATAAAPAHSRTGAGLDKGRLYAAAVAEHPGLPWEALPGEALNHAPVWDVLLANGLPTGALIRQLPRLTNLGLLAPGSAHLAAVTAQLTDPAILAKARVHPVKLLIALKTYIRGRSMKGDSTWIPVARVADALHDGFYAAFGAVEPAGKLIMLVIDSSGSMTWDIGPEMFRGAQDSYPFTALEIAAAMAMATFRTEPGASAWTFSTELEPCGISARQRLDDVMRTVMSARHGGTDCAAPMLYAAKHRIPVDTFAVYTDNETWAGLVHPHEALDRYRQAMGRDARLQVVSVVPTGFSIARPDEPRELDVSGFDSAVPRLLADHSRGVL